jgi:putative ATP-dependent endonuclease of the OLD family
MAKLQRLIIENFRSIGEDTVTIEFPENKPIILIGENNAGKSNIIRALELMFGEFHPKFKKLDDYDHFERNTENEILIKAEVQGLTNTMGYKNYHCSGFEYSKVRGREADFNAIQLEDGGKNQFVKNELREELLCIVVNSEQNLNYQLSYTSKYTLLSKVTKAFHDKLIESKERVDRLKGLFENIKDTFLEVEEFESFNSNMSFIAGQMLSNMSHALKFDFSAYDPSNYFKTLKVHPVEEGQARAYEELGTGQQQILALSFAHAYAKSFLGQGLIFVIDEPEAHLHPLAQKWLAKKMFHMAQDGLQIVITSHSPFFINLDFLEGINLVRKNGQTETKSNTANALAEYCQATGATKADKSTIIPFYSGNSTPDILNGFFAKKIILVEGPTEEFTLPILLESVGLDTLKNGIAVISVGGKGNLSKWWRFYTSYSIPTFVCFDNDASKDGNGNKRKDALKAIGIPEDKLGELLSIDDWNINDTFCVFGVDYEVTMRSSFSDYSTLESEEKERLGSSKPIIAREVAKRLVSNKKKEEDTGWKWFESLAKVINDIG